MFLKVFPCGPLQTNAVMIGCFEKKVCAVVDPSKGSMPLVLQTAKEEGFEIVKILLTHSHWDHIADLAPLHETTGAPVYVHPEDAKNVLNPGSDGLPKYFEIHGVLNVHFLHAGELVLIGNLELEVEHTPGHTPGGVCFYLEKFGILIAGDTLFRGAFGRVDLPTGDLERMRKTLSRLKTFPPETRVISGHGPETTILRELRSHSWDL